MPPTPPTPDRLSKIGNIEAATEAQNKISEGEVKLGQGRVYYLVQGDQFAAFNEDANIGFKFSPQASYIRSGGKLEIDAPPQSLSLGGFAANVLSTVFPASSLFPQKVFDNSFLGTLGKGMLSVMGGGFLPQAMGMLTGIEKIFQD